jgi:hypothetical protein
VQTPLVQFIHTGHQFTTDLKNELYRIEISEDQLRRGRRVRLPDLPEGILEY